MDASKINLFCSWKPDNSDSEVEQKKLMDDPESLRQLGQKLEAVQRVWKSYIVDASRGEILPRVGDGVDRAQLPADCLAGLEKVRQQAGQWLQGPVSVGVGMSMQEADRALQVSRYRGGDLITLWDEEVMAPELEEAHKQAAQEAVKDLSKADGPEAKEAPANKGNAGGGFSGRHEPGAEEKPMPPRAEGSEHSQGEVARAEASARPEIEGTHSGDLEEEFHDHAEAQEASDQHEAEQKSRFQDVRAKVVQILQQVKQAAPQLEQLKQQAPGLYRVLMEMTQALILTGKSLLESEKKEAQEGPEPVQKSERLAKVWEDPQTEASMAVFQDAAMEGRGKVLGDPDRDNPIHNPIPMPPGVSPKRPTARPRAPYRPWVRDGELGPMRAPVPSDPEIPREGWELTGAASGRTRDAAAFNQKVGPFRTGAEPADRVPMPHRGAVHDRDADGGFQGGWDQPKRIEDAKSQEQMYWHDVITPAQNKAFPIPQHDPTTGPDPHGRVWHYSWQYNGGRPAVMNDDGTEREPAEQPTWGIHSWLRRRDGDNPYGHYEGTGGRPLAGPYFPIDPQTGLVSSEPPDYIRARGEETDRYGNVGTKDYHQWGGRLNQFLQSLNGMHKKELEAALEKGKLPMPENAPKHTRPNWPIGWTKGDGKVKVMHPEDGKSGWVSVRVGQVLSNDGHPISSRNPEGR